MTRRDAILPGVKDGDVGLGYFDGADDDQWCPGDRVRLRYIMGEDSTPYLSDGTDGTVSAVYGEHVVVRRDYDGALVAGEDADQLEALDG